MSSEGTSSQLAIDVHELSKVYAVFNRPQDRLKQLIFRQRRKYYQEFRAVSNVSFSVSKGETVGIVGRNGSGKSTLLQMLCGTLRPTSGRAVVRGRIAALLELGAGFNPEFTGRENVWLNASLLGMSDDQIRQRFDEIASFASIGEFLDQPVKKYSSGMFARLAFAVAINVDPDILVVDEALSVGDEAFQRKCFSKIEELRERGATILFVSHSAGAIVDLCDRAILLHRGERILTGPPREVIGLYQKLSYAPPEKEPALVEEIKVIDASQGRGSASADNFGSSGGQELSEATQTAGKPAAASLSRTNGTGDFDPGLKPQSTVVYHSLGADIRDLEIRDTDGQLRNVLVQGEEYEVSYTVAFHSDSAKVRFGMLVKTTTGTELGGMTSHPFGEGIDTVEAGTSARVRFRIVARLTAGTYFLNAGVVGWVDGAETFLHRIVDALMFRVMPHAGQCITGYVDFSMEPRCTVSLRDDEETVRRAPLAAVG